MPRWKDEVARLDIAVVAEKLGLQLVSGRRWPRLALCPFHNDSTPSLRLYQGADPHYHCFACQAHGDTVELVKERLRVDFPKALDWLRTNFGVVVELDSLLHQKNRRDVRDRALDFWREHNNARILQTFAHTRGFKTEALVNAGISAGSAGAFLSSLRDDPTAQDDAIAFGLARLPDTAVPDALRSKSLVPFAFGDQVLIPLADLRGRTSGFMARRLSGDGPKYRFTTGFKKSEILYRGHTVRRRIEQGKLTGALDGTPDRFDLCVCEGVFDALRLEDAGIPAVATLGTTFSDRQVELVSDLAYEVIKVGAVLRLHVFYDADEAGRRGIVDSLPRLLKAGAAANFLVDVVGVDRPLGEKADPDLLIAGREPADAARFVATSLVSALDALTAVSLDRSFKEAPAIAANLDPAGSMMLQNRLARRLRGIDWPTIWRKLAPDRTTMGATPVPRSTVLTLAYEQLVQVESRTDAIGISERALPTPFTALAQDEDASLLHAMVLAREATDSREYPVDVAAWDRIEEAASLFLPLLAEELAQPRGPLRSYLAHYEPKESGAPRLKCGPCAEEAIQQQYILTELLRVRPDRKEFAERIPAVRYWADHPDLVVTGVNAPLTAVSFAYQVDMRALEERPDRIRRRDMFRPFIDCWNSFILHIGNRIDRMRSDLIYVAHLDVRSFYDNAPRHAVEQVLERALPETETLDKLEIAPLFGLREGSNRRRALIEWVLDHSFGGADKGYEYVLPSTGFPALRGGAKGLPQGPVLSSYLANILLFGLDADLESRLQVMDQIAIAEHGTRACGGLYARYVDDIVIAATSPEELRALRSAIEARLEPLGLELNEKSEHLTPMTADEARDWVVERRGAGFVAYGDVEDQPSPSPDIRTGWSDVPTLDRRAALSLLHWSALDDPEQTSKDEFEETLGRVARAEALRPTDLSHIARRIGLRATMETLGETPASGMSEAEGFMQRFCGLFDAVLANVGLPSLRVHTRDAAIAEALSNARGLLAALTGLERLVLGNPEGNPDFSRRIRDKIASARTALLGWILNDRLLARLQERLIPIAARENVEQQLGAQFKLQRASLEERAATVLRLRTRNSAKPLVIIRRPPAEAPDEQGARGIRIGWLRTFAPDGLAGLKDNDPTFLFHVIAAEVQVEGGRLESPPGDDGLKAAALADGIRALADRGLSNIPNPAQVNARDIAAGFRALAGEATHLEPAMRMRTISALLGLSTGPHQAQALGRRPVLVPGVADGANVIPLPSIPDQPGLFCYHRSSHSVRALIVAREFRREQLPAGLAWTESPAEDGLRCWSAPLLPSDDFLLDPETKVRRVAADLETIADVFEGLVASHGTGDAERTALVHVFSLIGPLSSSRSPEVAAARWYSLSWRMPRAASEQLVFERKGDAIVTQRAPHAGTELWRVGQAVSDLFSIAPDVNEDEGLKLDRDPLQDRLKRIAFSRLRGRWTNGAQVAAALAAHEVPRSLSRIVAALREVARAGQGVGPLALEFLLSGRAMRCRMQLGAPVEVSGGWARYLEAVGSRTLRPGDDPVLFSRADVREGLPRTSLALARASDSIAIWAAEAEPGHGREILAATALAFELAALRSEVKDVVLAVLARMGDQDRDRLTGVCPDLSMLGVSGAVVLVEAQFGGPDDQSAAYDIDTQAKKLLPTLLWALSQRALPGRAGLERVTGAGWLTILGLMTGAVGFHMMSTKLGGEPGTRPAFPSFSRAEIAVPLCNMAARLLHITVDPDAEDAEAWPWEVSRTLEIQTLRANVADTRDSLRAVTEGFGLVPDTQPDPLRMLTLSEKEVALITASGVEYRIPWWRCNLLAASGDRLERAETTQSLHNQLVRPYSALLDSEGRLLVVQLLSESVSTATGLRVTASELGPEQVSHPDSAEKVRPTRIERETVLPSEVRGEQDASDDSSITPSSAPPNPPSSLVSSTQVAAGQGLAGWRERQQRSWRERGANAGLATSGYGRVAILQYNFADSYHSEDFAGQRLNGKPFHAPRVTNGPVDLKLGFEEHRRRRVLSRVLACCNSFGVEALVLPEYSVGPETINWLGRLCRQQGYKVSVWAGTFRQQHGFELGRSPDRDEYVPVEPKDRRGEVRPMEAVLTVLFRESQVGQAMSPKHERGQVPSEAPIFNLTLPEELHFRHKKYPSIGMYEEFKPKITALTPLMAASRSLSRIESFVTELICSELFVFNGPLNWVHLSEHLEAVTARYNLGPTNWANAMLEDFTEAAQVFSGRGLHRPRRSILFVPCATSRDADYTYFAQNAYLASGIVTAFCNASRYPAVGGSCFVGPGGWETRNGCPVPGPYHGAIPGVLSLNSPERGVLGPKENALVIVDVRPDNTVDGKPRSQTLGPPMRLVAHVPILEDHVCHVAKGWDFKWWQPHRARWLEASEVEAPLLNPAMHATLSQQCQLSSPLDLNDFADKLMSISDRLREEGTTADLPITSRNHVIAAAISLATLFSTSSGMMDRAAKMTSGLLEHPERLPCPALLDWMIVDLDVEGFQAHLLELSQQSPVTEHELLPPSLRSAAWRWIAPEPDSESL